VKKNLDVASGRRAAKSESAEKAERLARLKAKRDSLILQISSARSSIDKLHIQTKRSHSDLASAERDQSEIQRKVEEHDTKAVLLENYERQTLRLHSVLNEYHCRLSRRLSQLDTQDHTSTSSTLGSSQDKGKDGQESHDPSNSSSIKSIQELVDALASHLESTISNMSRASSADVESSTSAIPGAVEPKLASICSDSTAIGNFISRLSSITQTEIETLEAATDNLDVTAIEEAVLAKLEIEMVGQLGHGSLVTGTLNSSSTSLSSSTSSTPSSLTNPAANWPTVEELLERQRQEHVSRFIAAEKSLNSAYALQKQRDQMIASSGRGSVVQDADGTLKIIESSSENSENSQGQQQLSTSAKLALLHRLQNLELALCADEAAYETSRGIVEKLQNTKSQFERDLRTLKDKFSRIQQLDSENKDRQALCHELLRLNASATGTFEAQTLALRNFVSSKLVDLQRERHTSRSGKGISEESSAISGALMSREISLFQQLPMTTYQPPQKELLASISYLVEALELSAYQSIEDLVLKVSNSLTDVQSAVDKSNARRREIALLVSSFAKWNDKAAIQSLDSQIAQVEQAQHDVWLPILESSISQITKATEHCTSIQQLCADFVNQPAQHFVTWLKLDGKTFEQTVSEWKSYCHALRQRKARR
jgi:hypothetical protein